MTKRQAIDEIITLNSTAEPGFLARFDLEELDEYLQRLASLKDDTVRHAAGAQRVKLEGADAPTNSIAVAEPDPAPRQRTATRPAASSSWPMLPEPVAAGVAAGDVDEPMTAPRLF